MLQILVYATSLQQQKHSFSTDSFCTLFILSSIYLFFLCFWTQQKRIYL